MGEAPLPPPYNLQTETWFTPDDAETEHDDLGRGVLAIALARRLHLIWCRLNGAQPGDMRTERSVPSKGIDSASWTGRTETKNRFFDRDHTRAAFVLHLDAPWGGGKMTFANLLARVLNPTGYSRGAGSFLRERCGDADISGAFLEEEHRNWPEDARRPWIVVPFNAWQAEHVTPPWWVFYQTIRRKAFDSVIYEGLDPVAPETKTSPPETFRQRSRPLVSSPLVTGTLVVAFQSEGQILSDHRGH
ncbi:P-loop NTPase fold protein [Breoghania sp.]|uniref:P-loop NTPase fold protein n=1 Tax=Breoghania sp. TaxID=2065378 RepID=UPI0026229200|nr:P-loop NTPase fold protein [Breoghania sp.]MDJ0931783.1 hypothetical protein [Breoghania sp.]